MTGHTPDDPTFRRSTGEGNSADDAGLVGGASDASQRPQVEQAARSTTGTVGAEGRSRTGAFGNVGSQTTTEGPDDLVDIQEGDPL